MIIVIIVKVCNGAGVAVSINQVAFAVVTAAVEQTVEADGAHIRDPGIGSQISHPCRSVDKPEAFRWPLVPGNLVVIETVLAFPGSPVIVQSVIVFHAIALQEFGGGAAVDPFGFCVVAFDT